MRMSHTILYFTLVFLAFSSNESSSETVVYESDSIDVRHILFAALLSVTADFGDPDLYLDAGQETTITLDVTNLGPGKAYDVNAFISGNIPPEITIERSMTLGTIMPLESRMPVFRINASDRLKEGRCFLRIVLTERYGRFSAPVEIDIACRDNPSNVTLKPTVIRTAEPMKNIDTDIPGTGIVNPDAIAVIIGNRDYNDKAFATVPYAHNDAHAVRDYFISVFGYSSDNILYYQNARLVVFDQVFGKGKRPGLLAQTVRKDTTEVFIYFSGHGTTDLDSMTPYLVPVDASFGGVAIKKECCSLKRIFECLMELSPKSSTIVFDADFYNKPDSGGFTIDPVYNSGMFGRGVLFVSQSADEPANPYHETSHSLFTYVFLKSISECISRNRGAITMSDIYNMVTDGSTGVPALSETAFNARPQHPRFKGELERVLLEVK